MKKLLLLFLGIFLYTGVNAQCGNLYIAGVIDGPLGGGTPKAVQVCASGDIADLSIYGLGSANNGGGTDGEEFTFPAEETGSGDCFWISSNGSASGVTHAQRFIEWFGFSACYTAGFANINGDDAIELFCSGAVEDLFGDIDVDGTGQCWDHVDGWASNNTASGNAGAFDCADWTFSGTNALDGETTNGTATTPYPSPFQICPVVPVPVELISFDAKLTRQNDIELTWSTASEENNSHFEIEHSTNGRDYISLNHIAGAGTSDKIQQYSYIHEKTVVGKNYYRLRQVDFDGAFEYSKVAVVDLKGAGMVSIRPTLADEQVTLVFEETIRQEVQLQIFDITGRQVNTTLIAAGTEQFEMPVASFEKGLYFIQLQLNGEMNTQKFFKR